MLSSLCRVVPAHAESRGGGHTRPFPPGYHLEEHPRYSLIVGGSLLIGMAYGLGAIAATNAEFENKTSYLLIPIAGPWLTLASRDPDHCEEVIVGGIPIPSCPDGKNAATNAALMMDGAVQLAGALLITIGVVSPKRTIVADSRLRFVPVRLEGGSGLAVAGRF